MHMYFGYSGRWDGDNCTFDTISVYHQLGVVPGFATLYVNHIPDATELPYHLKTLPTQWQNRLDFQPIVRWPDA